MDEKTPNAGDNTSGQMPETPPATPTPETPPQDASTAPEPAAPATPAAPEEPAAPAGGQEEASTAPAEASGGKQVSIYSTPTCQYCKATKDFFQQHGIEYQEFDVAADAEKRKEMIEKSGQMGVPVTFVGDEMIIGFNEPKLKELLGIS